MISRLLLCLIFHDFILEGEARQRSVDVPGLSTLVKLSVLFVSSMDMWEMPSSLWGFPRKLGNFTTPLSNIFLSSHEIYSVLKDYS